MKKSAAEPGAGAGDEKRLLRRHVNYLSGEGASGSSWFAAFDAERFESFHLLGQPLSASDALLGSRQRLIRWESLKSLFRKWQSHAGRTAIEGGHRGSPVAQLFHLWKSDFSSFHLINRPLPSHNSHIETAPREGTFRGRSIDPARLPWSDIISFATEEPRKGDVGNVINLTGVDYVD